MPAKNFFLRHFLLLFGFIFFSLAGSASAQSIITAIPPRLDLTSDPGKTLSVELKVRNDSETSQIYTIFVDDFIVADNQGTPIPVSSSVSSRWSLKNWITAPKTIPVDPKSTQIVRITIRIPLTALPGGHYAMVTYMPNANLRPGELKKTASLIGHRVGSLIYLRINGQITESANLIRFTAPKFSEQGPIDFTGTVENLSDIHISPTGTITISNPLNQVVAEIPLSIGNVFPETIRDFATSWDQKWGWGRYKASLSLAYGNTGGILTGTILFWLFPIRLIIYVLVTIISILLIIILINKRSKKHQQMLEMEVAELKKELEVSERLNQ